MLTNNHARMLLQDSFNNSSVTAIYLRLLNGESLPLSVLYSDLRPRINPQQFQTTIALAVKRGLIKIVGCSAELDDDTLTLMLFKQPLVSFVNNKYGKIHSWVTAYLLQVHVSSYRQTIGDLERWAKEEKVDTNKIEKALDDLINCRIVDFDNID